MDEKKPILKLSLVVLFVVSMVALGLEILLTRVFAVILFTSHSFMAISLALLGTGAGAILAYLGKPLSDDQLKFRQVIALALMALLIMTSIFVLLQVEYVPLEIKNPETGRIDKNMSYNVRSKMIEQNPEMFEYWKLYTTLPLAFLPFLIAGYLQAIVFRSAPRRFGKLYGIDLVGATVGALTIPLLLYPLGLVGTITVICLLCLVPVAYAFFSGMKSKPVLAALVVPVVLMLVLVASGSFRVKHSAGFRESELVRDYWSPFARVACIKYGGRDMYVIDNSSRTFYVEKTPLEIKRYDQSMYSVAMEKQQGGNALIIASGGGQEIVMASHYGMKLIDAVEIAGPIVRDIVNKRKKDKGNPYLLPGVNYHIADGRSISMRSKHTYDIIQMLEVNCWTLASQIAQAWSPYFVFTQEAFAEYFEHLSDDGYLCYTIFSRSMNPVGGNKGRRFRSVMAGMQQAGIKDPEDKIMILSRPYVYGHRTMVMAKKTPFTESEIKSIRELAHKHLDQIEVLYPDLSAIDEKVGIELPENAAIQPTTKYIKRVKKMCSRTQPILGLTATMKEQNFLKIPINDDRPYISGSGLRSNAPKSEQFIGDLYRSLLKVMGLLMLVFIIVPFVIRRPGGGEKIRIDVRLLLILAMTGVGFMFIEMAGIYKYQLYLHHPTLAMILVLSSMILGAGLGSFHTSGIPDEKKQAHIAIYSAIAVIGALVLLVVIPLYGHRLMLQLPMPGLMVLVFLVFGGMGFVLGHVVPLAIGAFGYGQPNLLAWCWAITVTGSVIGTVLASILSREYGMFLVALLGMLSYVVVLLVVLVGILVGWLLKGRAAKQPAA